MDFLKNWAGVVALVILAIIGGSSLFSGQTFGASGSRFPNGISADTTSPTTGQVRGTTLNITSTSVLTDDVTLSGGDGALVVTTSNTATSSIEVGCIQMTATSTVTPTKLTFFASSTINIDGASITSGFGGSAVQGLVLWAYGTCP